MAIDKSTGCSSQGLEFNSPVPTSTMELSLTPIPGDWTILLAYTGTQYTSNKDYTQVKHPYT